MIDREGMEKLAKRRYIVRKSDMLSYEEVHHGPGTAEESVVLFSDVRDLLSAGTEGPGITGRDVHREWRDGMLAQGRVVAPERMTWETIGYQDQSLDAGIAERLNALTRPAPGRREEMNKTRVFCEKHQLDLLMIRHEQKTALGGIDYYVQPCVACVQEAYATGGGKSATRDVSRKPPEAHAEAGEPEGLREALRESDAAIVEYLEWGPMTGSDRDYHASNLKRVHEMNDAALRVEGK